MDNYQKLLLDKLNNVLKNIAVECYNDNKFEDIINIEIFDTNIDIIMYKIQDYI